MKGSASPPLTGRGGTSHAPHFPPFPAVAARGELDAWVVLPGVGLEAEREVQERRALAGGAVRADAARVGGRRAVTTGRARASLARRRQGHPGGRAGDESQQG